MIKCPFCLTAKKQPSNAFIELFGDKKTIEIIADLDDLQIVLDAAPLSVGHVLLVSKEHKKSFYNLWESSSEKIYSIINIITKMIFESTGMHVVVCEHGLLPSYIAAKGCIEHAHIHIIPINTNLIKPLNKSGFLFSEIDCVSDTLSKSMFDQYLYFMDIDKKQFISLNNLFPSQLIRKTIAQRLGKLFWSWKDYVEFADQSNTKANILSGLEIYKNLHLRLRENNIN